MRTAEWEKIEEAPDLSSIGMVLLADNLENISDFNEVRIYVNVISNFAYCHNTVLDEWARCDLTTLQRTVR